LRNIFLFIRRYFNLLVFILLQAFCVYLIVQYNSFHQAAFGAAANRITGNINQRYDDIGYYFRLKKTNDSLLKANEVLYNKLKENYNLPDSGYKTKIDSIRVDSILQFRTYGYYAAKVVSNSVTSQNNFVVAYGPNIKYLQEGAGVINMNNAVVGIITNITGDYAVILSLLHESKESTITARLYKTGEVGTISWDGKQPNVLTLNNIPKGTKVVKGDSVVTSGLSTTFPRGLLVGFVDEVYEEKSSSNYKIKIHTAADFTNLEFIYGITSKHADEVKELVKKAKAKL